MGRLPSLNTMSKKALVEQLRLRLASNDRRALRALLRIYQNQTADEQTRDATLECNGIGFTGLMLFHPFWCWLALSKKSGTHFSAEHAVATEAWVQCCRLFGDSFSERCPPRNIQEALWYQAMVRSRMS